MSADNWAICPKCKADAIAKRDEAKRLADECYGKVASEEYHRRMHLSSLPVNRDETLREDYELGVCEDGKFHVSYRAGCDRCGLNFKFKHEQTVL